MSVQNLKTLIFLLGKVYGRMYHTVKLQAWPLLLESSKTRQKVISLKYIEEFAIKAIM